MKLSLCICLILCSLIFLGACSRFDNPPPENRELTSLLEPEVIFEYALTAASMETDLTFSEKFIAQYKSSSIVVRTFPATDNSKDLSITVFLSTGSFAYTLSESVAIDGGVSNSISILLNNTQTGCWRCTQWERRGGYYVRNWVTKWVTRAIAMTSAAACARAGGTWAAAACWVTVEEVSEVLTWVRPYNECVKREFFRSCPY